MQTASEVINSEQRARVESAVSAAESKTCCEIVPVVATASGRYDRAEDLVGLWCAVLGAVVAFLTFPGRSDHGTWGGIPLWGQVGLLVIVMLACFIVGAVLADRFRSLRRLFTPRAHMQDEVNLRARELLTNCLTRWCCWIEWADRRELMASKTRTARVAPIGSIAILSHFAMIPAFPEGRILRSSRPITVAR